MSHFPSRERLLYDALEARLERISEEHPDHEEIYQWEGKNHAWLEERWNDYLKGLGIVVAERDSYKIPDGHELVSNPLYTTKTDLFVRTDVADRILAIGLP